MAKAFTSKLTNGAGVYLCIKYMRLFFFLEKTTNPRQDSSQQMLVLYNYPPRG